MVIDRQAGARQSVQLEKPRAAVSETREHNPTRWD